MTVTNEPTMVTPESVGRYIMEVAPFTPGAAAPAAAAFKRVAGITEITPPQVSKNLEDDSEINGETWASQIATSASWEASATIKVPRGKLPTDSGQAILAAQEFGVAESGLVWVRVTLPDGTTGRYGTQGVANVEWKAQGGSPTEFTLAEVTLTGRGALKRVTVDAQGAVTVTA